MKTGFKILLSVAGLTLAAVMPAWAQPTINISGGGTNVLSAAIAANSTVGATLVITDSATYTENQNLVVTPRYSATDGRRAINIEATAGANPTIVLDGAGFVIYAGGADVHVGSNAGGRINIDGGAGAVAGGGFLNFWYIGQEDGLASGQACQLRLENLNIDATGAADILVFGAGGNDGAPNTTGASATIDNCTMIGATRQVASLYGPASYASTVTISNTCMINASAAAASAVNAELGAFGLGGANSALNMDRVIVYDEASTGNAANESNAVIGRLGTLTIDHCDIYDAAAPSAATRGVTIVGNGNCAITNSIIRGDAGTANFGSGACTATDSNVTGSAVTQAGFVFTNVIEEWPVYFQVGTDCTNPDNFAVPPTTASRTHGSSPPLGARGASSVPVELSDFTLM